jgi:hypothetical protein
MLSRVLVRMGLTVLFCVSGAPLYAQSTAGYTAIAGAAALTTVKAVQGLRLDITHATRAEQHMLQSRPRAIQVPGPAQKAKKPAAHGAATASAPPAGESTIVIVGDDNSCASQASNGLNHPRGKGMTSSSCQGSKRQEKYRQVVNVSF